MSDRVVLGAGIASGDPASPVDIAWECVLSKAAKESMFEELVEQDDFIYSFNVNHCRLLSLLQLPCCDG